MNKIEMIFCHYSVWSIKTNRSIAWFLRSFSVCSLSSTVEQETSLNLVVPSWTFLMEFFRSVLTPMHFEWCSIQVQIDGHSKYFRMNSFDLCPVCEWKRIGRSYSLHSLISSFCYYLIGTHLQQSAIVQFLPNSSPSSTVCGNLWCKVSGNRKLLSPPMTDIPPITISGKRRLSRPFKDDYNWNSKSILLLVANAYQIVYERNANQSQSTNITRRSNAHTTHLSWI